MTTLSGYALEYRIHRSPNHVLYRGRRLWDGLPVVLKLPASRFPSPRELMRLRRSYEMLVRLDGRGAPKAIALEQHEQGLALVMEDTSGHSLNTLLQQGPLDTEAFLEIGLACCDALAHIHSAQILHKDINPSHILIDPDGAARFINFSDATDSNAQPTPNDILPLLSGSAAYIPPEQTGRVNRRIDHRSDYYALGATFYELLTGTPPFSGEDNLDLIHAHLSRTPDPPHSRNPHVSVVLSSLILKLLAKPAEERYQSLRGLHGDLTVCRDALAQTGSIPEDLALGERDRSGIFLLSQKLYGREHAQQSLASILEQLRVGQPELVLIDGPSGIGKTALVQELLRPLDRRHGTFLLGRFEEFRRTAPYAAIADAFSTHLRTVLSGSEQDLLATKVRLEQALVGQGSALIDLLPDLEIIIGPQPPLPPLPALETENRFARVFRAMMGAVVGTGLPLVLVLDDIQWADRSSLHLLQQILQPVATHHSILVIGTRRTDLAEPPPALSFFLDRLHSTQVPIHTVPLAPLEQADVAALLSDTLGCSGDYAAPLAAVCQQKTRGNPFFLLRFLSSLQERELVRLDHAQSQWVWRLSDIAELEITDNVVDLMVDKVSRLSPASKRALQRAACIGPRFDLYALSRINDVSPGETLSQLRESLEYGLIEILELPYGGLDLSTGKTPDLSQTQAEDLEFRFVHGRLHQAVYGLLDPAEQGLRHLHIGKTLLDSANSSTLYESLFAIVDQLNRGRCHIRDTEFRLRVAHLNLEACRKARLNAAYAATLSYAREGLLCLYPEIGPTERLAWGEHPTLTLELHTEAAEAAFHCGEQDVMRHHAAMIEDNAASAVDKSKAIELQVAALILANENQKALSLGFQQLAALGYPLPDTPSALQQWWAFRQCRTVYHRLRLSSSPMRPTSFSPPAVAALRLVTSLLPAILFCAPPVLPLATEANLRLAEGAGSPESIAYAIARYGAALAVRGHIAQAIQVSHVALERINSLPSTPTTSRCIFVALFHGLHWQISLRAVRDRLTDQMRQGVDDTDPERMGYIAAGYLACGVYAGVDLQTLKQDISLVHEVIHRVRSGWSLPYASCVAQMIDSLTTPTEDPTSLQGSFHDDELMNQALLKGRNMLMLCALLSLKSMLCVFFGRYGEARTAQSIIQAHLSSVAGTPIGVSHCFYQGLSWARDPGAGSQQKRLSVVRQCLRKLRAWSVLGPANTLHRERLLSAELARISGRTLQAAEQYDQAIKAAHDNGFTHEEALANEYAARFHEQRGRPMIAEAYRRQAHYRWHLWGATNKVAALEEDWPELAEIVRDDGSLLRPLGRETAFRRDEHGMDLAAVMKAARAISGEIHRPALLENLLKITMGAAGAQRGLLFLRTPRGWTLESEGRAQTNYFALHRSPIQLGDDAPPPLDPLQAEALPRPEFSRSVFNYAARTREAVVLNNASREGPFSSDPYIQTEKIRSLLCLPLFQQSEFKGILYLENNLTAGAFTNDRLEILRLLAAQVVISLDNALLYENLSELNRTLEAEVAERTREATEKSRLLQATLDNMSDGLVVYDNGGTLLLSNERALRLFKIPQALATPGTPNSQLVEAVLTANVLAPRVNDLVRQRVRHGGEAFPDRPTSEIELSDGRFVQMRRAAMPDGRQIHIFLDVTEERRREQELISARRAAEKALENLQNAQESLVQAEKMASLGQLVAGVAHEINTPIGITLTAASFLAERAQEIHADLLGAGIRRSQLVQFIEQANETTVLMMNNIHRASDLIQSFKQVAVDQTSGERRHFMLKTYLAEVLRSFGPLLRKAGHVVVIKCPDTLEATSYPGALTQILANLIMNSVTHAFPAGVAGQITLTAQLVHNQNDIELSYHDNGSGIPPQDLGRVFDPFFTTRRGSGGSGLGLNIVYNIATSVLKGTIHVYSTLGEGTRFVLCFPAQIPPTEATTIAAPTLTRLSSDSDTTR